MAYSIDEEHWRNNLAPLAPASVHEGARQLWQTAKRGIKRRPALTNDFVSRLRWVLVDEERGAERRLAVTFDAERTKRVLRKIARGLFYHHTGARDPAHEQAEVWWKPAGSPELQELIDHAQYQRRISDAFAYVGAVAADDPWQSLWVMWFFDQVAVVAFGSYLSVLRGAAQQRS